MYEIYEIRNTDNELKRSFVVKKSNNYIGLDDVCTYLKLCRELNLEIIIRVDQMQLLFDQPNPTNDFGVKITVCGEKGNVDELQRRWRHYILVNYGE